MLALAKLAPEIAVLTAKRGQVRQARGGGDRPLPPARRPRRRADPDRSAGPPSPRSRPGAPGDPGPRRSGRRGGAGPPGRSGRRDRRGPAGGRHHSGPGLGAGGPDQRCGRRRLQSLADQRAVLADDLDLDLDESLDITQRYWDRSRLTGENAARQLANWDRYSYRMLRNLDGIDAMVLPATRELAPPHRVMAGVDYIYTLPASLTGWPAVVVPVGQHEGLPVAVQILARPWRGDVALALAAALTDA